MGIGDWGLGTGDWGHNDRSVHRWGLGDKEVVVCQFCFEGFLVV
ncbi:MAG: hypothetical protein ACFKPT_15270 [Gloeotrichia echinulata GP01]